MNVTLRSCLRAETPVVYPRKKVYINESVNTYDDPDRDLHAAAVDAARKGEHGFFWGGAPQDAEPPVAMKLAASQAAITENTRKTAEELAALYVSWRAGAEYRRTGCSNQGSARCFGR